MRILIRRGGRMLGHQLLKQLRAAHEVRVTLRQDLGNYADYGLFHGGNAYAGIDVRHEASLLSVLTDFRPGAVVNAIGIVKQRPTASESIPSLEINALLPHRLALFCKAIGARLVHLSTDCVFSGRTGSYREADPSDAGDLYGRTKFLGEVHAEHCVTLRTSIIGKELARKTGLFEWFLAQRGQIKGFRKAIFSGFTTIEMSRVIERLLVNFPRAAGLYHVSSDPITKYDLLTMIKERLALPVEIVPDDDFRSDRSLDSSRFRAEFGYVPPTWDAMLEELCHDFSGATQ